MNKLVLCVAIWTVAGLSGCAMKNPSRAPNPNPPNQEALRAEDARLAMEAEAKKANEKMLADAIAKRDSGIAYCKQSIPEKVGQFKKRADCIAQANAPLPGNPYANYVNLLNTYAVATYEQVDLKKITPSQAQFLIAQYDSKLTAEFNAQQERIKQEKDAEIHRLAMEAKYEALAKKQTEAQRQAEQAYSNQMMLNGAANLMRAMNPTPAYGYTPQLNCQSRVYGQNMQTNCY